MSAFVERDGEVAGGFSERCAFEVVPQFSVRSIHSLNLTKKAAGTRTHFSGDHLGFQARDYHCTNVIWMHTRLNPGHVPFCWKILLSGFTPAYLHEQRKLDTNISFEELQRRSPINEGRYKAIKLLIFPAASVPVFFLSNIRNQDSS
ncbi:MAG: hypothetical protein ABIU05_26135 [Nitrospirales bacterium]